MKKYYRDDKNEGILKNINYKSAFTLAEVLITLGIIGVVAALTIPSMMAKYQKNQYMEQLKKSYSAINQALIQVANENDCTADLKCTGLFASGLTSPQAFGDELVKYLNVVKNCGMAVNEGCFTTKFNEAFDGSSATNYNYDAMATRYKFVTGDGVTYALQTLDNDCTPAAYSSNNVTGNMAQVCARIYIDVTGTKPPNFRGRDVFTFWITNGKGPLLYPTGGADDKYGGSTWWYKKWNPVACSDNPGYKLGYYCTGRVIDEGWKMNY